MSLSKIILLLFLYNLIQSKLFTFQEEEDNIICIGRNCDKSSYESIKNSINNNRLNKNKKNDFISSEYESNSESESSTDQPEKPTSTFHFFLIYLKQKFFSFFSRFDAYFEGFKFLIETYKKIFGFNSYHNNNNKSSNHTFHKGSNYFRQLEELENPINYNTDLRNLDQVFTIGGITYIITNGGLSQNFEENYPYNNTDLYTNETCPTIPDLKVNYYIYFCEDNQVSFEEYNEMIAQGKNCEFYNNTRKICFCPVNYVDCKWAQASSLKCSVKEVIVNNNLNLTEFYDTFFEEYLKTPFVPKSDNNKYKFSIKVKCGMSIPDDASEKENFYLSNINDELSEIEIISTEYHEDNETFNGTQYDEEDIKNTSMPIVDYFIKKKNLIILEKPEVYLRFSIVDMKWVLPYRIKEFQISNEILEDFLQGEKSFDFEIDMEDLIKNGKGLGPFERGRKNLDEEGKDKYPIFDKGDLHFFEIDIYNKLKGKIDSKDDNDIYFFPFRGEIKK